MPLVGFWSAPCVRTCGRTAGSALRGTRSFRRGAWAGGTALSRTVMQSCLDLEAGLQVYAWCRGRSAGLRTGRTRRSGAVNGALLRACRAVVARAADASGYRVFDESALDELAFISRAKGIGMSLEDIADLVASWPVGRARPALGPRSRPGALRARLHLRGRPRPGPSRSRAVGLLARRRRPSRPGRPVAGAGRGRDIDGARQRHGPAPAAPPTRR